MNIISWNTLYRDFEIKYEKDSEILKKYPQESKRILTQFLLIEKLIHSDKDNIICLQECSDELYQLLREKLGESYKYFTEKHEDGDMLVTITPLDYFRCDMPVYTGFRLSMLVSNNTYDVLNCHLKPQFMIKGHNVLSSFKKLRVHNKTIICGDFNESYNNVQYALNRYYTVNNYGNTYKDKKCLDYILYDFKITEKTLYNLTQKNTSDHNIITLTF